MCGISGIYSFSEEGRKRFSKLDSANRELTKRGPDGGATYVTTRAVLGHRRLSIIDVSCSGDQPMTTTDGRYTIVFNGEIFNYQELKNQLTHEDKAALRSTSDTEVFLILYARLGTDAFRLLRGFFAAAIYDNEKEELVLVRDRFGKKPLLIYKDEDAICFASEMKALFAMGIPRLMNWDIAAVYFQLNYVPQPHSMIQGVEKLPPGHYIKVNASGLESKAYYRLEMQPGAYDKFTYEKAQERLVTLMDESVRMRLVSDVPLGAFLSGGIDSSVVVAMASRHTSRLNTFSIGYKDHPYFDETRYAKLVADKYKTEHTVFSLSNNDFLEHVHNVLNYIDEPFADSSAIPVYILSHYTRKHVTVALSGDGGDEVFAGYNKHGAEWRMRQGGVMNAVLKTLNPVLKPLPKSRNGKLTNKFRQLHRFSEGAKLNAADRYWQWASFKTEEGAIQLLHPKIKLQIRPSTNSLKQSYISGIAGTDLNEALLADMNLVLLSDMLVKVDLMSMANSLEIRSPFLDSEVVDFAFGLPASYKIDGTMKKKIVQDAFRPFLPDELYNRPKQGFEIPLLDWFRKELWALINEELLEEKFVREQQIFDVESIQLLKKQLHSRNPGDSHATIWALIVFQHWWKHYMAG